MLASSDDFSDLLIFKRRNVPIVAAQNKDEKQSAIPSAQQKPTEQPKVEQKIGPQPAVQQISQPQVQPQQMQPRSEQIPQNPKAALEKESVQSRDAKGKFCINHPWREAYSYCAKDGLPYCFVDLIQHGGKMYCLNDIDNALRSEGEAPKVIPKNGFSIISSALLFANSILIFYFAQSQTNFVTSLALKQGILSFILNLNPLYFFPVANIAVIVFGILAGIAILGRSPYLFLFAFVATFGSLFIMVYQYFSNTVSYSLLSSIVLLITVSALTYSRMSSVTATTEKYLSSPTVNWPKPEVF